MQHFRLVWKKVGLEAPKRRPEPQRCFLSSDRHTDSLPVSESSERRKASSHQVNKQANTSESCFLSICNYFLIIYLQWFDSWIPHQTPVLIQVPARWSCSLGF